MNKKINKELLNSVQKQSEILHSNEPAFKKNMYFEMMGMIIIAFLMALSVSIFLFQSIRVQGPSMLPTFSTGERVVAEKISYRFREPRRGDVIICHYRKGLTEKGSKYIQKQKNIGKQIDQIGPNFYVDGEVISEKYYIKERVIKRVLALPNEKIEIVDGKIYINDHLLNEVGYWKDIIDQDMSVVQIPKDEVFVIGDNRNRSWDSRDPVIGSVPYGSIVGRVVWVLWPINKFGIFNGFNYKY